MERRGKYGRKDLCAPSVVKPRRRRESKIMKGEDAGDGKKSSSSSLQVHREWDLLIRHLRDYDFPFYVLKDTCDGEQTFSSTLTFNLHN